jgi:hypothetical protein
VLDLVKEAAAAASAADSGVPVQEQQRRHRYDIFTLNATLTSMHCRDVVASAISCPVKCIVCACIGAPIRRHYRASA